MPYNVIFMSPKRRFKVHSRNTLFQRQKGLCFYCHRPVLKSELTIDHIIPLSKGGTHTMDNFVGSCAKCNVEKSSMDAEKFILAKSLSRLFSGD